MPWSVYIARCGDGTYYTGMSTDVAARIVRHNAGRGAKYVRGRGKVLLAWRQDNLSRRAAAQLERRIKRLSHKDKAEVVQMRYWWNVARGGWYVGFNGQLVGFPTRGR